jgi:SOS-response transcriptional repressor LexA
MLCFIAGYIEHHGYAPCLREMAAALGLASKRGGADARPAGSAG